jgi:hypothetical protein
VNKAEQKKLVEKLVEWIGGYEFIRKDLYLSIGYSAETILGDSVSKLFELSVEAVAVFPSAVLYLTFSLLAW